MDSPTVVSGAVSTVSELGKDEAWLGGWLKEQPARLGLGELDVSEGDAGDDELPAFVATDDDRCFSVDVQLGEIEASRGFGMLDNWARNRVRHPDKTHVAVLVTEDVGDRYQTTLRTLAEHLPLVVVELTVWRGEKEAIVVPRVALSSDKVDLGGAPGVKAAKAAHKAQAPGEQAGGPGERTAGEQARGGDGADHDATNDESQDAVPENKDDTGVADPWGLPPEEPTADDEGKGGNGSGQRLLNKIGT